jgi:hypothetical protein
MNWIPERTMETTSFLKKAVFWVVALHSLIEVYQCFRGTCCLYHQGNESSIIALMQEAASCSETLVNCYQTTQHNPEDSHLHKCHHENLKTHFILVKNT